MSEISGESASKLKETDQAILNVEFEGSDTCLIKGEVAEVLKKFVLSNRGVDDVYNYRIIKGIDEVQRRFLGRLNSILTMLDEKYVDNFINTFYFYRAIYNEEYLKALKDNNQCSALPLIVQKLSHRISLKRSRSSQVRWKQVSLDILLPNEREDILKYMSYIWYKGKEILQKHLEHEGDD